MNTRIMQTLCAGYKNNASGTVLSAATGRQLALYSAKLNNKSGAAIDLGVMKQLAVASYSVFKSVVGTGTDISALLAAGTPAQTLLTTTNNDLYVVQAKEKFSLIGFTISQAETGSPVYTYKYWTGAAWATLTTLLVPTTYAVGTALVVFLPPNDWVVGGDGTTGISATQFSIQVKATTAPSTAVQATAVWVAQMIDFAYQVANNLSFEFKVYSDGIPLLFEANEGLLPYFGGTANAANLVQASYAIQF